MWCVQRRVRGKKKGKRLKKRERDGQERRGEEEEEAEELGREAAAQLQGPASTAFARIFLLPFQ